MEMKDALAGTGAAIHGESKILAAVGMRDLGGDTMQVSHQGVVLRREVGERRDVPTWNHQHVCRRRGVDVAKSDGEIVLVNPIRSCLPGSDSAEEAIRHVARLNGFD